MSNLGTQLQPALLASLKEHSSPAAISWLQDMSGQLHAPTGFNRAFALVSRQFSKDPLPGTGALVAAFDTAAHGWQPQQLSALQVARLHLLFSLPADDHYLPVMHTLFTTAEVDELVTLYTALPGMSAPAQLLHHATEGLRTNIGRAFNALALHNPYPAHYFDTHFFNQMVLKAAFIGSPLFEIVGIRTHVNKDLVSKLKDYVDERRAAGRPVSADILEIVGAGVEG